MPQILARHEAADAAERRLMAYPEIEAAWRAEFKRIGEIQLHDALNSGVGPARAGRPVFSVITVGIFRGRGKGRDQFGRGNRDSYANATQYRVTR